MATETTETWNRSLFFPLRTFMHIVAAAQIICAIYYDFNFSYPPPGHLFYSYVHIFSNKLGYLTILSAVCSLASVIFIFCNRLIWQAIYFTLCILNDFIGTNEFHPKRPSAIRKFKDYIFAAFAFPLALNVVVPIGPSRKLGITSLIIFKAVYLLWIHIIKYTTGKCVYPILEVLDMPQRIVFMVSDGIICFGFYVIGEYLNNKVWKREIKPIKSSDKKQK